MGIFLAKCWMTAQDSSIPLAAVALLAGGIFTNAAAQDNACTDLYLVNGRFFSMAEAGVPPDQWITFIGGWNPIQWDENPVGSGPGGGPAYVFPTLEQMDAAAGGYPFYLHLRANEAAYTNSPGMARLNELAAGTEGAGNPQIDPATGFVADSAVAFGLIRQDSDPREQAIRVMRGFNSVGLSVVDVGGSIRGMGAQYFDVFSDYETIKALYDDDALTIRVRALVQGDLITPVDDYEALVRSIAGEFGTEDDSMFKVIGSIRGMGAQYFDVFSDYETIKALGYEDIVGINLSSHAFFGRGAAGRVCDSVAFRTVVEQGLHAGIGTDSTNAQPGNPWINIYAMVTGKDVKGFGLRAGGVTTLRAIGAGGMGGMVGMGAMGTAANAVSTEAGTPVNPDAPITCPDERISRAQAVQLHTRGSAWLAGSEDHYGTLEEGKLADLVVLSDDVFSTAVSDEEIQGILSLMTIVDGEIVYVGEDAAFSAEVGE